MIEFEISSDSFNVKAVNHRIFYTLIFVLRVLLSISNYSRGEFEISALVIAGQYTLELQTF